MKHLLLVVALLFMASFAQPQEFLPPQNPPAQHDPKACSRPDNPRKDHVACGKCELKCENGRRVEDKNCPSYCRSELCACHRDPCCEGR